MLSTNEDGILAFTVKIAFHRRCRSSYITKRNVSFAARKRGIRAFLSTSHNQNLHLLKRCLRSNTSEFDNRNQCSICGSSYKRSENYLLFQQAKETQHVKISENVVKLVMKIM